MAHVRPFINLLRLAMGMSRLISDIHHLPLRQSRPTIDHHLTLHPKPLISDLHLMLDLSRPITGLVRVERIVHAETRKAIKRMFSTWTEEMKVLKSLC